MLIDFDDIKEIDVQNMNNGTGLISAKMFMDKDIKIIPCTLHVGASIGTHKHLTSDDINYILSGEGIAFCNGNKEKLTKGCCHICKKGEEHSIINNGNCDMTILTIVIEK